MMKGDIVKRIFVATLILLLGFLITASNEVSSTPNSAIRVPSNGEIRWAPTIYFPLFGQGDFELFPFSKGSRSPEYDWDWVNGAQVSASSNPTSSIYIQQSPEHVQHGSYSAEFHIGTSSGNQHCKLFESEQDRYPESYWGVAQLEAYYSAWYWFPAGFAETFGSDDWRLIMQWADAKAGGAGHFPTLNLGFQVGSEHRLKLCNNNWYRDGGSSSTKWDTGYTAANIPKEQWVHLIVYVKMSSGFRILDGQATVWINGLKVLDRTDIALWNYYAPSNKGVCWAVGNYGKSVLPSSIWIDNIQVAKNFISS